MEKNRKGDIMAENILILGNGFDLAQKRKTSYTDFLEFLRFTDILIKIFSDLFSQIDREYSSMIVDTINNKVIERLRESEINQLKYHNEWLDDLLNQSYFYILAFFENELELWNQDSADSILRNLHCVHVQAENRGFLLTDLKTYDNRHIVSLRDTEILELFERYRVAKIFEDDKLEIFEKLYDSSKFSYNVSNNLIIRFINENKQFLGQNWSSLELVISDLAEALSDIKTNLKEYRCLFAEIGQSAFEHQSNPMAYLYVMNEIIKGEGNKPLQSVVDTVNEKFVFALEELTDWLEFYLTYLDELDKEKEKVTGTVLDEIFNIGRSEVINFNYTDTIKRFGVDDKNIHFIHGRLNFHRAEDEINTMVFGIEDKQVDLDDIASELIPYQKFYQRVVKETGNDFEEFFKDIVIDNGFNLESIPKNIIIYGHSVDPLDKEIFQKCFELAEEGNYNYRFIFVYYNENDKRSIAKNLAIILGKHNFISLSGKKKIAFVRWNDKEKMKTLLLP